jgi:predicted acylesterase/phospholipase RssA
LLIDGGVAAKVPVSVAFEKGAQEIYALDIDREGPRDGGHWNAWEVAALSLKSLIRLQWERDLKLLSSHD